MFRIEFMNGRSLSLEEVASLIEKEGALGKGILYNRDTHLRCVLGVLHNAGVVEDIDPLDMLSNDSYDRLGILLKDQTLIYINDNVFGEVSPEERCKGMVRIFRELAEEEVRNNM